MISTHVLDTALGKPAAGVRVTLERATGTGHFVHLADAETDIDGRVREVVSGGSYEAGTYRLTFDTGRYFASSGVDVFYPCVIVSFVVRDPAQHHHVPLLLSPFGYTTYRGS